MYDVDGITNHFSLRTFHFHFRYRRDKTQKLRVFKLNHLLNCVCDFNLKGKMKLAKIKFVVGQLVYGKVRGYPPWPARVTEINKNVAKIVYFNWNNQFSKISFDKITPYHSSQRILLQHYGRNTKFSKAVDEMEFVYRSQLEQQQQRRREKEERKKWMPSVIVRRLSPLDIKKIKGELKKNKKKLPKLTKKLRSGRKF